MDTAEALKLAMKAVKDAGIPEEHWATALPLALADLRGASAGKPPNGSSTETSPTRTKAKKRSSRSGPPTKPEDGAGAGVFQSVAVGTDFINRVARQTETKAEDLHDVFHIENGALQLKVLPKNLGDNDKAKTMTVTALMAGAVFAGSDVPSIRFAAIHQLCKSLRCYSEKHAAEYVRETSGFGSIGTGRSSALTHKSGWENEFAKAVARVLKKGDDADSSDTNSGRTSAKSSSRKTPAATGGGGDGGAAKKRSLARAPKMVNDLNLRPKGKPSLQEFMGAKALKSQDDKNAAVIYYLKSEIGVEKVSADHVFSAYREMKADWKLPSNLRNSLQVTKSTTGWIDTSDMDDIKITASGTNHVEHDLRPKPKT